MPSETSFGASSVPSIRSSIIVRSGARRRSVGEPGLRIQVSPARTTSGTVRVAVDDRCAAGEAARQPLVPPGRGTAVVHHPDLHPAGCDDELARQELLQRLLVGVPVHRVHRRPE